jgi:2-polyprenyl-6-methoxyphenol hydroxylase-like FAD-dependent oxidoreductase
MTTALIVGGGIAGAVTAMALQRAGIDAVVHEAYPTGADDIGAFLTIMKNGMNALRVIDAHQPVIDAGFPATDLDVYSATGDLLSHRPMSSGAHTITRATLYRVLHDEMARRGIPMQHGKRLVAAETTASGVAATFADGTVATGDVLVGADGIHSTTRTIIDPTAPPPRYTGLTIAYGYTRATTFAPSTSAYRMIFGQRAFFGYTTAPDGETWWFARAEGTELTKAEFAAVPQSEWRRRFVELFVDDQTDAAEIIRTTDTVICGNAYDVPETAMWHRGAMVLAGDAAHAASPAAGQGASMALEDSVILAKCLRDHPVGEAFEAYVDLRRERVEKLVATSANQGTRGPSKPESWSWLYDYTIDWDR